MSPWDQQPEETTWDWAMDMAGLFLVIFFVALVSLGFLAVWMILQ
jgi:hypothetical protein